MIKLRLLEVPRVGLRETLHEVELQVIILVWRGLPGKGPGASAVVGLRLRGRAWHGRGGFAKLAGVNTL
jgi:hypothetical protein